VVSRVSCFARCIIVLSHLLSPQIQFNLQCVYFTPLQYLTYSLASPTHMLEAMASRPFLPAYSSITVAYPTPITITRFMCVLPPQTPASLCIFTSGTLVDARAVLVMCRARIANKLHRTFSYSQSARIPRLLCISGAFFLQWLLLLFPNPIQTNILYRMISTKIALVPCYISWDVLIVSFFSRAASIEEEDGRLRPRP
jgi:hypothetical protein